MLNYFTYPTAAERYAKGRPFFHSLAVDKIQKLCCKQGRIKRALDVGCGTGQSSLALLDVADEIVGVDFSGEMLARVSRRPQISYVNARAECLPFVDHAFGLVSVGLAFHWLDAQQFLPEATRILRPGGWLFIYNDRFTSRMIGNDDYSKWSGEQYQTRYPAPPRNQQSLSDADAQQYGFIPAGAEQFAHEIEFTAEQLVDYLLTQSNVIAAVEAGTETVQSVAEWLLTSVRPFFKKTSETFSFWCDLQVFRRA